MKHKAQCNDTDYMYIDKVQVMLTMTEKNIVKMRCNSKNRPQSMNIFVLNRFQMCKRVQYAKLLFDIHAGYFVSCSPSVTLYVLAFAHHFACTCIRIHILSFKNVDTFYYSVVLNKVYFARDNLMQKLNKHNTKSIMFSLNYKQNTHNTHCVPSK